MHFYLVIVAAKVKVVSGVEKHVFAEEKKNSKLLFCSEKIKSPSVDLRVQYFLVP